MCAGPGTRGYVGEHDDFVFLKKEAQAALLVVRQGIGVIEGAGMHPDTVRVHLPGAGNGLVAQRHLFKGPNYASLI